ncbi:MAG: 50S ribosomal protein L24 [Tissierellia bacterium]|nr:50S ribosomal protein L24 [Tissierellia bacterium]
MHIKKGDKVQVISGKYKGVTGEVKRAFPKENKVIVEGVNIQKKHKKPTQMGEEGGIIDQEGKIHASNVLLYSEELKRGVRTSIEFVDGKKVRVCKKTNEKFD